VFFLTPTFWLITQRTYIARLLVRGRLLWLQRKNIRKKSCKALSIKFYFN